MANRTVWLIAILVLLSSAIIFLISPEPAPPSHRPTVPRQSEQQRASAAELQRAREEAESSSAILREPVASEFAKFLVVNEQGYPVPGAHLLPYSVSPIVVEWPSALAVTDEQGAAAISAPAERKLAIAHAGYQSSVVSAINGSLYRVTLRTGYSLTFRVIDESGNPMDGVPINISQGALAPRSASRAGLEPRTASYHAVTDPSGTCRFEHLVAANYNIGLHGTPEFTILESNALPSMRVAVPGEEVVLRLGELRGLVVGAKGDEVIYMEATSLVGLGRAGGARSATWGIASAALRTKFPDHQVFVWGPAWPAAAECRATVSITLRDRGLQSPQTLPLQVLSKLIPYEIDCHQIPLPPESPTGAVHVRLLTHDGAEVRPPREVVRFLVQEGDSLRTRTLATLEANGLTHVLTGERWIVPRSSTCESYLSPKRCVVMPGVVNVVEISFDRPVALVKLNVLTSGIPYRGAALIHGSSGEARIENFIPADCSSESFWVCPGAWRFDVAVDGCEPASVIAHVVPGDGVQMIDVDCIQR